MLTNEWRMHMQVTDILFQYLNEVQYNKLKTDKAYQAALAAKNQAIETLTEKLSPEQVRLFNDYIEQANFVDVLELRSFFSHCSVLLLPSGL